jgi:isocitrate dehydrogenase
MHLNLLPHELAYKIKRDVKWKAAAGIVVQQSTRRIQMAKYRIAAIPGDGIGVEVIDAGLEVLKVCAERDGGFDLDVTHFDWGSDYYKKNGVMMPECLSGNDLPSEKAFRQ